MNIRIKKYIICGALLFAGYFLATQHIVINERDFRLLKKSELTYEYTFYNITDKTPDEVLRINMLRDDGIGEILVEFGYLSEEEKYYLENYYDSLDD